ncbi:MAG: hypothetical protein HFE49_05405 [Clostridia bacterium]|nr:hypothetical protein [Clostridia bacterium]
MKGLIEWIYEMVVSIMEYAAKELVGVMSMDMTYFEKTAPVIKDITNVILALGWGLLIANLMFQSIKVMMSGAGFEGEDPKSLFLRTFTFSFLLLASRQICNIAMGMTGKVIEFLQIPSELSLAIPDQSMFSIGSGAKWLIVIVVGFILIFQYIKLLFEIGERYVVTSVLTFFAPLAFSMGGSKNTNDIFKGWCRMYGSMMVMMIMNIVFLKLILSAMGNVTSGSVLIWLVFVIALTRVARKIDSHIGKIGLNPAQTGDGVGSRLPGMMTMVAVRTMASTIGRNISANRDTGARSSGGQGRKSYGRYNTSGERVNHNNTEHTATAGAGTSGGSSPTVNMAGGANTTNQQNTSQPKNNQSALNQNSQGQGKSRQYDKYGLPHIKKIIAMVLAVTTVASATVFAEPTEGNTPTAYTGTEIKPDVSVESNGSTLVKGTDYELTYENNINVGTATVKVTFKGNYEGERTVNFNIIAKTLSESDVVFAEIEKQTYTGGEVKPEPTITYGDVTLEKDKDYTLTYENNINVGKGKVIVTFIGNYTGTASSEFDITAKAVTESNIKISPIADQLYTGSEIKPEPVITEISK